MERIERSAVVPASREKTFALVADVASYPEFVPLCRAAEVRPLGEGLVEASLRMARGPIRFWLTTRNREVAPSRIEMRLVKGPFGRLSGRWSFEDAAEGGTRVSLNIEFEGASRVLGRSGRAVPGRGCGFHGGCVHPKGRVAASFTAGGVGSAKAGAGH